MNARSSTSKSSTRNVKANDAAPYERLRRYGNAMSMRLLMPRAMLEEGCRPLGSNADHSDRRPDGLRDPIDVRERLGRQRAALRHPRDRRRPPLERLVARTSSLQHERRRHVGGALAVELVARTERDPVVHVQDVEFGHGELGEGVETMSVPGRDGVKPADAPRTPRRRAVLVSALAEGARFLAVELGRKWPLADGCGVRLHDTDDARDLAWRDARPNARAARERIRARHVGIDAPVEIAHRAELTFEKNPRVLRERRLHEGKRVDDAIAELRRGGEDTVRDFVGIERSVAEALEYRVLDLELAPHARAEALWVLDLVHLDAVAADLVGVRRPHAHTGRAELLASALALVESVERDVPRQEEMRAVAHTQVRGGDTAALEIGELAAEEREVDDASGTEHAERIGIEDSARNEMKLEGAVLIDDCVPGVVAALDSDDDIRLLRQEVRDLAFALVAPLSTDDGRYRHVFECYPPRCPATSAPSFASSTNVRLRDGSLVHQRFGSQSVSSAGWFVNVSAARANSRSKSIAARRWWYGLVTRIAETRPRVFMSSATRCAFSSVVADAPSTATEFAGTPAATAVRFMSSADATESGSLEPPEKMSSGAYPSFQSAIAVSARAPVSPEIATMASAFASGSLTSSQCPRPTSTATIEIAPMRKPRRKRLTGRAGAEKRPVCQFVAIGLGDVRRASKHSEQ